MTLTENITQKMKAKAHELGFDLVGVTLPQPSLFSSAYREWIAEGRHGEMGYLERNLDRRLDTSQLLDEARSIISVGMNYYSDAEEGPGTPDPSANSVGEERAIFARYARGDDYHDVMTDRLKQLLTYLKTEAGGDVEGRVYVDAGPVLEREVAQKAGLGWFGKNTLLINSKRGSYFFLGELITNLELTPDTPAVGGCGTCRRCLDACPTGAIIAPFQVDARRCLSYLTIELKGDIPVEFSPAIADAGNRIFGCDICQEVCPFNLRRAEPTSEPAFQSREITKSATLSELSLISEEEFREKFRRSPVKRTKHRGLMRNVEAALKKNTSPKE